ncbi:MAG TPA: hypothetical protein VFF72_02250 [Caldimonas sp.]|nr:hypothetical protein [Caldimonas sp.]
MFARLSAFVIWSLVAATVVFWSLRLGVRSPPPPAYAVPAERSTPLRGDLARLFGAAPVLASATDSRPEAPSRYRLLGVMAPRSSSAAAHDYGFALIAIDGKPARAYSVGAPLDSGLVLKSVGLRTASLGPADGGAQSMLLELPRLPTPATGVLPVPGARMGTPIIARPVSPVNEAMTRAAPSVQPVPGVNSRPGAMEGETAPSRPEAGNGLPAADDFRSQ